MPTPLPAAAAPAAPNVHAARVQDVVYPCSDGKPMADNMWQARAIMAATGDLEDALSDALVAADILVYPEQGNNRNKIAPDVLVALGLGTHERSSYLVWEEGKPPDWVLEVASPSTQTADRRAKRQRYAEIGVPEYWLFAPKGNVYPRGTPRLQGLALVDGRYCPLPSQLADGERMIRSEILGLDVYAEGKLLRFRDPTTGSPIRHRPEIKADDERRRAAVERAEARIEQEAVQRKAAEAQSRQDAALREAAEAQSRQDAVLREAAEARVAELEAALRSPTRHPP